jgi:hypothetical protein
MASKMKIKHGKFIIFEKLILNAEANHRRVLLQSWNGNCEIFVVGNLVINGYTVP